MTSSSCSELRVQQGAALLCRVELPTQGEVQHERVVTAADGHRSLELSLQRSGPARTTLRVHCGKDLCLVLPPGAERRSASLSLRDEYGELVLRCTESSADAGETTELRLVLALPIAADAQTARLYETLVTELEAIHLGLAREVVGRTQLRWGESRRRPRMLRPEEECQALAQTLDRLEAALHRIRRQPAQKIEPRRSYARWRPGDRLAPGGLAALLREPETVFSGRRPVALGRARVLRKRISLDIPEHRALRAGLVQLDRRAQRLAAHCEASAQAVRQAGRAWGEGGEVHAQEFRPLLQGYADLIDQAEDLQRRAQGLLERNAFLREAGAPRSTLQPTPLFRDGAGYREAYAALQTAELGVAPLVSGEEFRIHLRSLARLYEYWCYVQVVLGLRRLLGVAPDPQGFEVVDEVYRPDLQPGQYASFALPGGGELRVSYEPEILPHEWRDPGGHRFRASLSSAPLRPDVLLEVDRPGLPPAAMVLDAKSKTSFGREDLARPTDYRSRIFDPESGCQPVRQVFFLHRAERDGQWESLPGYLAGRRGGADSWVIGALPCLPWQLERLEGLLARFLQVVGVAVGS